MKRPTLVLCVALSLAIGSLGAISAHQRAVAQSATDEALLERMSAESQNQGDDGLLDLAHQLWERRAAIDPALLIRYMRDTSKSATVRNFSAELYVGDGGVAPDARAKTLLTDESLPPSVRTTLLVRYVYTPDDTKMLHSLASQNSPDLSFHALLLLGKANPVVAIPEAEASLADAVHSSSEKRQAALKVLARYGGLRAKPDLRNRFIASAVGIINSNDQPAALKEAAAFSLSEVRHADAIAALLRSHADRTLRTGAIDENFDILANMIVAPYHRERVLLVAEAMQDLPVRDLAGPLRAAADALGDSEVSERVAIALKAINERGVAGNLKWTD